MEYTRNMRSERLVAIIKFFLYVAVLGTPLFYLRQAVYPYTLPKTAFFEAVIEIAFFLWIALAVSDARYRPRATPIALATLGFLAVLVITAAFGVNPARSIWSTQERALGVFAFAHLAALATMLSSLFREIKLKSLPYWSLGVSALVAIIAFLQIWEPHLLLNEPIGKRPGATFGNPGFLAGYLIFNIFIGIYFLIDLLGITRDTDRRARTRWTREILFLSGATILDVAGIFRTQTRGDILGLALGIVVLVACFAWRPPKLRMPIFSKRSVYALFLLVIVAFGAAFWLTRSASFWENVPGINRFRDISISDQGLLPRFIALRAAGQGFLEKPYLGWGWDNFNVVFNKYYDPRALELSYQETRFDKPHNAILEYFVVGGVPLGVLYLVLLGAFVFGVARAGHRLLAQTTGALLFAYLVRNFFSFETLGPLLMLFTLAGIADGLYRERFPVSTHEKSAPRAGSVAVRPVLLGILSVAAVATLYIVNVRTISGAYHQFWGFTNFARSKPSQAIISFKKGSAKWSPYQMNFKRDYATAVAEAFFYNPDVIPNAEAWKAVRAMEEVARAAPNDAYNHYALVDLYNQVSDLDPATLLDAAEKEAAIALELSPDRQEVYFSLAKTKSLKGDYAGALEILKKALDLDPKVPDAHFYYGLIAFETGDEKLGDSEIKAAIQLGREWKNYYEPRAVANYYADAGKFDEAIGLYLESLALGPKDLETRIKLGAAYFFAGDRDLARKYLGEAAQEFDFKTSPSYEAFKPILDELGIRL